MRLPLIQASHIPGAITHRDLKDRTTDKREKVYPMEGQRKLLGGRGLKAKFLEEKYEAKLEFPGGSGSAK